MAYTAEMFERAQRIINDRKNDAELKAEERRRAFAEEEPDYIKYRLQMINSVKEAIKAIDMSPERARKLIDEQKEKNLAAQTEIRLLLAKHGHPADWLDTKYFCPKCSDTGIYESHLCSCHIDLLKQMAFDEAGKKSPLRFSEFSDFRLDWYPDKKNTEFGCSSRERMKDIFDYCRSYAEDFDHSSPSILMRGETGLGKTHLSLAIAGEIIKKGMTAIYNSAQNIFNELQKERFGKNDSSGQYEAMLLECDLLVIDDLGAEFSTQFTNAALYNIINTRINSGLPTVISTNLDLKEIEERYTRRISSRLIGEYALLEFFGEDIRQKKNE